ncbi:MAG: hypothetical protein V1702_01300 [Candidatus Woesearchaeota archaeon]
MERLYLESDTFKSAHIPLISRRIGVEGKVRFREVPDVVDAEGRKKQEALYPEKLKRSQGKEIGKSLQYGLSAKDAETIVPIESYNSEFGYRLTVPVSVINYSRIEYAISENSRDLPNVLGISEIFRGRNSYLFVKRGEKVAYYDSPEQLHALVAGGFPRNITPIMPDNMTVKKWLDEQQMTEHAIKPSEVAGRVILGVVLDKLVPGYKPEILLTGFARYKTMSKKALDQRKPLDSFERDRIVEAPATEEGLAKLILENSWPGKNVPVGLAGAILELGRIGGFRALDNLISEAKQHGAPTFKYAIRA